MIEVSSLAQMDAIRYDLDGDGFSDDPRYANAFPGAMPEMSCAEGWCTGYELVNNLDFDTNGNGAADAGDTYWNGGSGWLPIGDEQEGFTAVFEGNGYTIGNLYINRNSRFVGLFGLVRYGGIIGRVGLVSAAVRSEGNNVGPLAGLSQGRISDSYATGKVVGWGWDTGGLVGANVGTILGCHALVSVTGGRGAYIGGLVGQNAPYAIIASSYATGDVYSRGESVGGLVGGSNGGGLIIASYSTGSVSGEEDVGGLVGTNYNAKVVASYATGRVLTLQPGEPTGGGLVGRNSELGQVIDSYWSPRTARQSSSDGGESKTIQELQSPTGYTGIYAYWDVDVNNDGNLDDPWDFGTSTQYPVLRYGTLSPAAQR